MRFTERIQVSFALHPCTNFAVNDERRQLETYKKTMLLTDDERFRGHKNRSDTCSSWQEKCVNSNGIRAL